MWKTLNISLLLSLLLLLLCIPASANQFSGQVVGVIDGDTIDVLTDRAPIRVRLNGIDCPEKSAPFGKQAKKFASDLAFKKIVTVHVTDIDRYGRTVGKVILPDGRSLNQELVRAGYAWWYRKYASKDFELMILQRDSRSSKTGLWDDPDPLAPWEFRREREEKFQIHGSRPPKKLTQKLSMCLSAVVTSGDDEGGRSDPTFSPDG